MAGGIFTIRMDSLSLMEASPASVEEYRVQYCCGDLEEW